MTKYDARAGFLPILVVSIPSRVRKGAVRLRVTHGTRTGRVGCEKHCKFPCGARTTPARASHGVSVKSRTSPVAWCDHENNTDVKFLLALHSALRPRNRTGAKIVRARGWMGLRHYIMNRPTVPSDKFVVVWHKSLCLLYCQLFIDFCDLFPIFFETDSLTHV